MKTKRRVLKKVGRLVCLALFVVGTQSCETEIPLDDRTPPGFSFRITGDGFDHTFDQDTDFDNIVLKLRRDTSYDFTLSGADSGGLRYLLWSIIGRPHVVLTSTVTEPWTIYDNRMYDTVKWNGDENNPLSGTILTGSFRTGLPRAVYGNVVFRFSVSDFGGDSRTSNIVTKELNIVTGHEHPTRIDYL